MDAKTKAVAYCEYLTVNDADIFTVVCLPRVPGPVPTVIMRSPYIDAEAKLSDEELCQNKLVEFQNWLDHGYAVVFQHCRGRGKSSGDCIPYIFEREDGLFLQDWIRKQPFYNGELYLCGGSYTASVHLVTAPFADDIKGAVFQVQDCERYNCCYRNGFYRIGLHGVWYAEMYKKKSIPLKNYTEESCNILPFSNFSPEVLGEHAADLEGILQHPDKKDAFWQTRYGGGEAHNALRHANIPILLVTGFYDLYTGGVFDMWNTLDGETKGKSALAVHPFDHHCVAESQPINFENGDINRAFGDFSVQWMDSVRGKDAPPFEIGKVTYYKLFADQWCCDDFTNARQSQKFCLGSSTVSYTYDPDHPATFRGGLNASPGGNAWQDAPSSREDIVTLYTPEFAEDTFVKGKMTAKLRVKSDCEDTCFFVRISLCKAQGDYGLRDDIQQISNFCPDYIPSTDMEMTFSFDEHAFVIQKGEKLRIDISSSALPHYVRHTNHKGLFSEQTATRPAVNSVNLSESHIELPLG